MGAPVTGQVGQTGTPLVQEWSGPAGTGNVLPPVGAIGYVSDTPAVATVDPVVGTLTLVSAGTANITATDAGDNLSDTVAVTVTAAPPQTPVSLTLNYTLNPLSAGRAPGASRRF